MERLRIFRDPYDSLQEKVQAFCEARRWDQYHSLKNLTIGAVTEAAELVD